MDSILNEKLYIAGSFCEGKSNESFQIIDKYHQDEIASVKACSEEQVYEAIAFSESAFEKYKSFSMKDRSELLFDLAKSLKKHQREFSLLISAEAGKPIDYARVEVERSIDNIEIAARYALNDLGETVNFPNESGLTGLIKRFPIGPVVGISPFNFPLNLALHKILPALVIGNPIILKPSPYAPLTLLSFCKLIHELGLPEGMLSVLMCDNDVASILVKEDRIKLLSFTGSAEVGFKLKSMARKKPVVLELGGNAACVVDRDIDVSEVAKKVCHGSFLYAGQICISTQRVYVHHEVFEEFVEEFVEQTEKLKCSDPGLEGVVVGPLIDQTHFERVKEWVIEAVSEGAEILTGGYAIDEDRNIYAPTVLTNTSPDMKVVTEEVFGPVVCIEQSDSFHGALDLVNDSRFGLQAGVFTDNIHKMKKAFELLDVGAVIMNNVPGFRIDHMPYGGIKDSGIGREGIAYAMEHMSERKLLVY